MPVDVSYFAAFVVGFTGGVHCVSMCGGIVGALSFGTPETVRGNLWRFFPYLLAYNGGRLLSYALAGAIMGGLGLFAANLIALHEAQRVLLVAAGLFMVALGLYLGGWWMGVSQVERAGATVWRRLEPLGRRFVPVRSPGHALALGLVWGWLPCGLVYTALIWSLSSGGPLQGALLLLSFGLGTLPNLLAMGLIAGHVAAFTRRLAVRRAAGVLVVLFGVYTVARAFG